MNTFGVITSQSLLPGPAGPGAGGPLEMPLVSLSSGIGFAEIKLAAPSKPARIADLIMKKFQACKQSRNTKSQKNKEKETNVQRIYTGDEERRKP